MTLNRELTKVLCTSQNVVRFHGSRVNVISLTFIGKYSLSVPIFMKILKVKRNYIQSSYIEFYSNLWIIVETTNWTSSSLHTDYSSTCRTVLQKKIFPSLTVSSHSSFSVPFNSSFLRNPLHPFIPSVCRRFPLALFDCFSLPGHSGIYLWSCLLVFPTILLTHLISVVCSRPWCVWRTKVMRKGIYWCHK